MLAPMHPQAASHPLCTPQCTAPRQQNLRRTSINQEKALLLLSGKSINCRWGEEEQSSPVGGMHVDFRLSAKSSSWRMDN